MIANEDLQEMKRELTLELDNGKYEPLMKVLVLSTGRFINQITRRSNPIPMWYSATLLATLILIVDFSVSLLLNEAYPIRLDQVAFEIMIMIFVVLVVLALIKFHDDSKIRLNAVVIENIRLGDNLNDIRNWKGKVYDINLQIIVCIIYSVMAGAYTIWLLAFQSGTFVGFGPSIFYVLSSFLTGTILYMLIMTGLFYARLGKL
jgi:hypothetical protein